MTIKILQGDVFARLAELPDESVHCVVTSPPYWGLRSYGDLAGEIGREPTLAEHIDVLVRVFREVRRVLRPDGTCWMNYGDAYANDGKWGGESGGKQSYLDDANRRRVGREKRRTGLKPKDLMLMPARVALALQADGWWVRSEIIWEKPNPLPESVKDRPTSAHEKIFLLTKSTTYFYDAFAVRTPMAASSIQRFNQPTFDQQTGGPKDPKSGNRSHRKVLENLKARTVPASWAMSPSYQNQDPRYPKRDKQRGHSRRHDGLNDRWDHMTKAEQQAMGANLRNVWTIAPEPFRDSHYATFPTALAATCIKAGTSQRGACSECGAPLVRLTDTEHIPQPDVSLERGKRAKESLDPSSGWGGTQRMFGLHTHTGWTPSCACEGARLVPCRVLDPFGGAGTVGLVADRLGRDAILIELSPTYAEMAKARIRDDAPLLVQIGGRP